MLPCVQNSLQQLLRARTWTCFRIHFRWAGRLGQTLLSVRSAWYQTAYGARDSSYHLQSEWKFLLNCQPFCARSLRVMVCERVLSYSSCVYQNFYSRVCSLSLLDDSDTLTRSCFWLNQYWSSALVGLSLSLNSNPLHAIPSLPAIPLCHPPSSLAWMNCRPSSSPYSCLCFLTLSKQLSNLLSSHLFSSSIRPSKSSLHRVWKVARSHLWDFQVCKSSCIDHVSSFDVLYSLIVRHF